MKRATRGRPRAFDRDEAVRQAMQVFWDRGYENASLAELTTALGINPPSLYAAFGDKESLFIEALRFYARGPGSRAPLLEAAPTARAAVEALLQRAARALPALRRGCMLILSATHASSEAVRACARDLRADAQGELKRRIERGIREGDVPAGASAGALAQFYETVLQGLSIQAADGATPRALQAVIHTALRAWPG